MKLSVVIPCYNEAATIESVIDAVKKSPYDPKEIIVVDDCSRDGTRDILEGLAHKVDKIFYHDVNRGKGAALRTGFRGASGDIVIVQDADLEYDPAEYPKIVQPILSGKADVVYGSRFMGGEAHRVLYFWHRVGNGLLTLLSNMCTNLNLTDGDLLQSLQARGRPIHRHQRRPFRLRTGDHGQGGEKALPRLRGGHLLLGPHLRRRQKNRLERRGSRHILHSEISGLGLGEQCQQLKENLRSQFSLRILPTVHAAVISLLRKYAKNA
jgi:glycosyltransferase involved in cell wall biosynthesis